jgi:hypothetical protein
VQPTNSGPESSSKVIPFKRGAPSTSKQVGQIPASYTQGVRHHRQRNHGE